MQSICQKHALGKLLQLTTSRKLVLAKSYFVYKPYLMGGKTFLTYGVRSQMGRFYSHPILITLLNKIVRVHSIFLHTCHSVLPHFPPSNHVIKQNSTSTSHIFAYLSFRTPPLPPSQTPQRKTFYLFMPNRHLILQGEQ